MEEKPRKKPRTSSAVKNRWNAKNYDTVHLNIPKGQKAVLKEHSELFDGGSVNGFIKRAINEQMKRDLGTNEN